MKLDQEYLVRLESVINICCHLCLFPIKYFSKVGHTLDRIKNNTLGIDDIEGLNIAIDMLIDHKDVNDLLRNELKDTKLYLEIKVQEFAYIPPSTCLKTINII
jgi:hypothetical protein